MDNISRLFNNYYHARRSWETWCYLSNYRLKNDATALKEYVDNDNLLSHLRYLALKDFHIQLYKVLKENKNNPDNIFTLSANQKNVDQNLLDAKIADLRKYHETIKAILDTRDKYFAHFDADHKQYIYATELSSIAQCITAIENVMIVLTSQPRVHELLATIPLKDNLNLKF